jgi:transcriptional regulator with XRE-family HTH domain
MSTVLSRRLKKAREEYGVSQKDLGLILGLSDKAISAYESARITPPIYTLKKISEYLKKPLSYFVDEEEESYSLQTRFAALENSFLDLQKRFMEIKGMMESYLQDSKKDKKKNDDGSSSSDKMVDEAPPALFS